MGGASGHLDDPQGYSGGWGRSGGGLTWAAQRRCPRRKEQILNTGISLRFRAVVPGARSGQTGEVSRVERTETGQKVTQGSAWFGVMAGVKAERRTAKARVIHGAIKARWKVWASRLMV